MFESQELAQQPATTQGGAATWTGLAKGGYHD